MIKGHSVSMNETLRRIASGKLFTTAVDPLAPVSAPIISQPAQSFFSLFKLKIVRARS